MASANYDRKFLASYLFVSPNIYSVRAAPPLRRFGLAQLAAFGVVAVGARFVALVADRLQVEGLHGRTANLYGSAEGCHSASFSRSVTCLMPLE